MYLQNTVPATQPISAKHDTDAQLNNIDAHHVFFVGLSTSLSTFFFTGMIQRLVVFKQPERFTHTHTAHLVKVIKVQMRLMLSTIR